MKRARPASGSDEHAAWPSVNRDQGHPSLREVPVPITVAFSANSKSTWLCHLAFPFCSPLHSPQPDLLSFRPHGFRVESFSPSFSLSYAHLRQRLHWPALEWLHSCQWRGPNCSRVQHLWEPFQAPCCCFLLLSVNTADFTVVQAAATIVQFLECLPSKNKDMSSILNVHI